MNQLFNLCSVLTNKLYDYCIAHPNDDTDELVADAMNFISSYDQELGPNAINALNDAILRGDNFATSEARHIIRKALETL